MNIKNILINLLFLMPKSIIWSFAKKYIAGSDIHSAIVIAKKLNNKGIMVTIDILGENITQLHEAEAHIGTYKNIINKLDQHSIQGGISVKPTFVGLKINTGVCYQLMEQLVDFAAKRNCFVRIDMEDSSCTTPEIELFEKLRQKYDNVGLVFQAYLKRTKSDIESLHALQNAKTPINYRICKGIYVEPAKIAIKDYQAVRNNYIEICEWLVKRNYYTAFATHDKFLVSAALDLVKEYGLSVEQYEFQMLYGVTPKLCDELVVNGHPMRVYLPFGKDWLAYCKRRFKENPSIVKDIVKGLFRR